MLVNEIRQLKVSNK